MFQVGDRGWVAEQLVVILFVRGTQHFRTLDVELGFGSLQQEDLVISLLGCCLPRQYQSRNDDRRSVSLSHPPNVQTGCDRNVQETLSRKDFLVSFVYSVAAACFLQRRHGRGHEPG